MTALNVTNTAYLIARTIEQAPSNPMMVRELIQNAIEASIIATNPKIHVLETDPAIFEYQNFGFGKHKLTFWNNGTGMTAKELRDALNFSSSHRKVQSLHANFGIGAKALSMSVNQEGMIWVTCKNEKISTAMLYKSTNNKGEVEYSRWDFVPVAARSRSGFTDVWDLTDSETIPWSKSEEWTAVILCGNNLLQKTISNPYDPAKELTSAWLINEIYRRYFRIPKNLELKLSVGHSKGKDKSITFKSIYKYIQDNKSNDIIEEFVEDKHGSGIKVWYLYDGPYTGKSKDDNKGKPTSVVGNPATTPSFSGIVYKDEIYDVCSDYKWKAVASKFGILFGAKHLRIFVEIPDNSNVTPDQYRTSIKKDDPSKTDITMLDYVLEIRDNMPEWFRDKIREFIPKGSNSNDIQKRAQDLLDSMIVSQLSDKASVSTTGTPRRNNSNATGTGSFHKPPSKRMPLMGGAGSQYNIPMSIPSLQFIRLPEDLDSASAVNLKNRAAEYVEDAAIYINCTYNVVDRAVDQLILDYQDKNAELFDRIKDEAKNIAENEMAWQVLQGVVFAISKKRETGFGQEDIDKALDPNALTTHADRLTLPNTIIECSKQLKEKVKMLEEGLM